MDDLHLVGLTEDGNFLVLAAADGEQYRLPLDDRLLAAVRGSLARVGQLPAPQGALRPAEIQARIRGGQTAEAVALAAGLPVAKVRRYEGPVLAERAHVAREARRTPVRRRGDGFVPLLDEIVTERLVARGATPDTATWDSYRLEDALWLVSVAATAADGALRASWTFDLRRRLLNPADDEARRLSDEPPPEAPRRPVAPVQAPPGTAPLGGGRRLTSVPSPGPDPGTGGRAEPVEPAGRVAVRQAETPPEAADPPPAPQAPHAPQGQQTAPSTQDDTRPGPDPDRDRDADPDADPALAADAEADADSQPGPDPGGPPPRKPRTGPRHSAKGRRAAVPAWDDIVFGARRPD